LIGFILLFFTKQRRKDGTERQSYTVNDTDNPK